ncbi:hypothetical protein GCM10009122_42310 [Fulvivirga kasyanovii]|uniref:hypothetical protein n=1 Tax=Fulvivirga kasyanovii TaxID=396812 RepID=UPI0031D100AA
MRNKLESTKSPDLEQIIIIDWYDDIVKALIRFKDIKNWYFSNLLVYGLNKKQKIYSLVLVQKSVMENIFNMFKEPSPADFIYTPNKMNIPDYEQMQATFQALCEKGDDAYLILVDDLKDGIQNITNAKGEPIILCRGIDEVITASNEERNYLFNFFNS